MRDSPDGGRCKVELCWMELFLHNILISLGWEKKETAAPRQSPEWQVGEDRWESVGPLSWLFLDVPSGTAAVSPLLPGNAKGRLLSRAGLAASFALFSLSDHSVPRGRWCRYSERGRCPCPVPTG